MSAPKAAVATAEVIMQVMRSPAWVANSCDPDEQGWILLRAICRELHPMGSVAFPSEAHLTQCASRRGRDEDIRDGFDGRNYEELGRKHGLSTRQVRRLVDEPRKGAPRNPATRRFDTRSTSP